MITSGANATIKQLIKWRDKPKERRRDNIFIAEGIKMYAEAPKALIQAVYISESFAGECDDTIRNDADIVADDLFLKISDTETPQGILTLLRRPEHSDDIFSDKNGLYIALENMGDPGNLGTIIRTAEAAGVKGVLVSNDSVDIYNPKAVRATMGAIYRVPFLYKENIRGSLQEIKNAGIKLYAAHLKGKSYYDEMNYTSGCCFIIGNESRGITEETASLADEYIRLPMEGSVESLNASMAAGILMYEAYRQRRKAKA
ncbi:MAG: RNA methyltransferase [Lachnospiraceae bacterium]|nr:RNA methyltransferase [Lachnospiraceae bacterium]